MMNRAIEPMANKAGVFSLILAFTKDSIIAIVITSNGSETATVETVNIFVTSGFTPVTNMWCPQTTKLITAAAAIDITMYLAPYRGLLVKVGRMSAASPIAGNRTM